MRFAVVIEKADGNYSAYVPDLPGCVATAATVHAVEVEIRKAIRFHIEGLSEDGKPKGRSHRNCDDLGQHPAPPLIRPSARAPIETQVTYSAAAFAVASLMPSSPATLISSYSRIASRSKPFGQVSTPH